MVHESEPSLKLERSSDENKMLSVLCKHKEDRLDQEISSYAAHCFVANVVLSSLEGLEKR